MPNGREIARYKALGSTGTFIDTKSFAWRFIQTLLWKGDLSVIEVTQEGDVGRTFALHRHEKRITYTPHSDQTASLQERGEQSYTTEPHELSALDAYRETAGLTSDEGEDAV